MHRALALEPDTSFWSVAVRIGVLNGSCCAPFNGLWQNAYRLAAALWSGYHSAQPPVITSAAAGLGLTASDYWNHGRLRYAAAAGTSQGNYNGAAGQHVKQTISVATATAQSTMGVEGRASECQNYNF